METEDRFVRVRDGSGNDFICPLGALKDVDAATDEALEQCVDDGTFGRYAGNVNVLDDRDPLRAV